MLPVNMYTVTQWDGPKRTTVFEVLFLLHHRVGAPAVRGPIQLFLSTLMLLIIDTAPGLTARRVIVQ